MVVCGGCWRDGHRCGDGRHQGCGSGSAWIRIHFPSCIRIRIQNKIFSNKNRKNARKLVMIAIFNSIFEVNLHKLHCFLLKKLFIRFFLQILQSWIRIRIKKTSGSAKIECRSTDLVVIVVVVVVLGVVMMGVVVVVCTLYGGQVAMVVVLCCGMVVVGL